MEQDLSELDAGARAVLSILLERVSRCDPASPAIRGGNDGCANCGEPRPPRAPYCCRACREMAGFIRQMRQSIASGALDDPERQVAKGEVLWRLLGGGLPRREARIPDRSRLAVLKAQAHTCQVCGGEADRIENTGTG